MGLAIQFHCITKILGLVVADTAGPSSNWGIMNVYRRQYL